MNAPASHSRAVIPAFPEPVFDAARSFRAILNAMSRPGTIVTVEATLDPPAPMGRAMGAALLTLCDVDTALHLDAPLAAGADAWSDFHTGAPRTNGPAMARFVFVNANGALPDLDALQQGDQAYPDRSATCVLACERLSSEGNIALTGPGIETEARLDCERFGGAFLDAWARNGRHFPRGVDLILTCGDRLAALPRTTRLRAMHEGAA